VRKKKKKPNSAPLAPSGRGKKREISRCFVPQRKKSHGSGGEGRKSSLNLTRRTRLRWGQKKVGGGCVASKPGPEEKRLSQKRGVMEEYVPRGWGLSPGRVLGRTKVSKGGITSMSLC